MNITKLLVAGLAVLSLGARAGEGMRAFTPERHVEVVFVLDSTGSMGGLIEGAKRKIWSIANTIASVEPTPRLKVGLVSYRDRGDQYVTKRFDLTDDLDAVYGNLQGFKAQGGGDTPESVNQGLNEAVTQLSWSDGPQVTKIIFLVGDCPPHMDYDDDVKYPETCKLAVKKNMVINTIQCGSDRSTTPIWQDIARKAEGEYIALAQDGAMQAMTTPYDAEIATVNVELNGTLIRYGSEKQQREVRGKLSRASKASASSVADRAAYNAKDGGKVVQGWGDLVNDIEEKEVDLATLKEKELPENMQKMTPEEREKYVAEQAKKRAEANAKMMELVKQRDAYIAKETKRLAAEGKGNSFDLKVVEVIKAQMK